MAWVERLAHSPMFGAPGEDMPSRCAAVLQALERHRGEALDYAQLVLRRRRGLG